MNANFKLLTFFLLLLVAYECEGSLPILDAIISGVQKTRADIHDATHMIIDNLRPHSNIGFKFESHFNLNGGEANFKPPPPYPYPENQSDERRPIMNQNGYGPPNYGTPSVPPQQQPNYQPQNNYRPNMPNQQDYDNYNPITQPNGNYNPPEYPHMSQNNGNANLNDNQVPTNQNKNQYFNKNAHYQDDTSKTQSVANNPDYEAVLDNIFGNKKHNDSNKNFGHYNDDKNMDDKPLFVPLNPKRETSETNEQVKDGDEEFPIDVRFNNN